MKSAAMKKTLRHMASFVVALILMVLAPGCVNNAVVFTTTTRTGIEINAAESGKQSAKIGFERFEAVTMPTVVEFGGDGDGANTTNSYFLSRIFHKIGKKDRTLDEAYPVYSRYRLASGGLLAGLVKDEKSGMRLRQMFATGDAAKEQAVRDKVDKDFDIFRETFVDDDAGERIRCFWKPDGNNINQVNANQITAWMSAKNVKASSITEFIRSAEFTDERKQAVNDLRMPPCNE